MLHRSLYLPVRSVISAALAVTTAACGDAPAGSRVVAPPTGVSKDWGPLNRVDVIGNTWVKPAFHRTKALECKGYDYHGEVYKTNRRTWRVKDTGIVSVTPHYTWDDSGSTATLTGGSTIGSTWVFCTIRQYQPPYVETMTDSVQVYNDPTTWYITWNDNNASNIPPGSQRMFNFILRRWDGGVDLGGALDFAVSGSGTKFGQGLRTVTVQATGALNQTIGITASMSYSDSTLLNALNQPYTFSTSTSHSVTIAYDPVYASMTGDQTVCSAGTYQWQVNATGGTGSYAYQWSVYWVNTGTTEELGTAQTQSLSVAAWQGDFQLTATVNSGGATNSAMTYVFNNAGSGDC